MERLKMMSARSRLLLAHRRLAYARVNIALKKRHLGALSIFSFRRRIIFFAGLRVIALAVLRGSIIRIAARWLKITALFRAIAVRGDNIAAASRQRNVVCVACRAKRNVDISRARRVKQERPRPYRVAGGGGGKRRY